MKPVIVHVVQHLKPGGIESFALEFQRAAQPHFDVHIISLEKQSIGNYWNNTDGFKDFIHMLNKKPGWQANIFTQLKQFFEQVNPMYVHTHHIGPLIYGGIAAKLAKVNHVIHTEHDAWHLADKKARFLQKLVVSIVKPIYVADAYFVAQEVNRLMPLANPFVIPNGVDTNKFKPATTCKKELIAQAGLPSDMKFIGCAARLEAIKSHDVLIKAIQQLPSNVALLLAGTGSLQAQLQELVCTLGLEQRVFFLGHVENMSSFYSLLDVFCLSSSNEGLPLSPMEAQACGVPAVLTDVGGCKEAVCRKTGLVVQPNNAELLGEALNKVLNQKMRQSPRAFIKNHRSMKKMINQYISLTQAELRWKLC